MQEENFEKGVRQKMEELSFTPSAPVWQKVEEQLRKKKERRRLIFWLLPFLILTGAMMVWLNGTEKKRTKEVVYQSNKVPEKDKQPTNITVQKEKEIVLQKKKNSEPEKEKNNEQVTTIAQQTTQTKKVIKKPETLQPVKQKNNKEIINYNNSLNEPPIAERKKLNPPVKDDVQQEQQVPAITKNPDPPTAQKNEVEINTSISGAEKKDTPVAKTIAALPVITSDSNKQKNIKTNAWQWGINARVGISGVSTGLLNLGGPAAADFSSSPVTGSAAGPMPPAPIEKGLSFATGIQISKKISERLTVSTGLHYSYFSTHQKVGQNVARDTTISRSNASALRLNSYYLNNRRTITYRNNYHFIEVPLEISYQVLKRVPLRWQIGTSLGRFVSANALSYDRTANLYYRNNSLLRKTQLNGTMALTYTALQKGRTSLLLGPQWQYSLTPLNKDASKRQHLFFLGLKAQLSFQK